MLFATPHKMREAFTASSTYDALFFDQDIPEGATLNDLIRLSVNAARFSTKTIGGTYPIQSVELEPLYVSEYVGTSTPYRRSTIDIWHTKPDLAYFPTYNPMGSGYAIHPMMNVRHQMSASIGNQTNVMEYKFRDVHKFVGAMCSIPITRINKSDGTQLVGSTAKNTFMDIVGYEGDTLQIQTTSTNADVGSGYAITFFTEKPASPLVPKPIKNMILLPTTYPSGFDRTLGMLAYTLDSSEFEIQDPTGECFVPKIGTIKINFGV